MIQLRVVRNALITFLIVLAVSTSFLLWLRGSEINRELNNTKLFFEKSLDLLANSISVGYFKWTEMYEAFVKDDKEWIEQELLTLKEDFTCVEDVFVTPTFVDQPAAFQISSENNSILISFAIFDSAAKKFIENRVVIAKIDPNCVREMFNIQNIEFNPNGKDFVYRLRIVYKGKILETFHLLISFVISIFAAAVKTSSDLRQLYLTERAWSRKYRRKLQALESILNFVESFLRTESLPESIDYEKILQDAVEIVPGAEAGSILLEENGVYVFKAAVGFPLEELKKVKLKGAQLNRKINDEVVIVRNLGEFDKVTLSSQELEIMSKAGAVYGIKATLSIPIIVQNKVIGYFNLDNFHDENAFDEDSIEIAKVLTSKIGLMLDRIYIEQRLRTEERMAHQLFKQALRRSSALKAIIDFMQKILGSELLSADSMYQEILEAAVNIVPRAQAGSLILKEGDFLVFRAAVGYDLTQLRRVKFNPKIILQPLDKNVRIVRGFGEYNSKNMPKEDYEILSKFGRVNEIKASISLPIVINEEVLGFMVLDNFENEDAFDEESLQLAQLFSNITGVLLEHMTLQAKLEEQKRNLEYLSYHDPLTQLPNRRYLSEMGEKILAVAKRENVKVSFLYIDLRAFKKVNDTFGHREGDNVLIVVGQRMKNFLRKSDVVGRIGGDEFVVIAYKTTKEDAYHLAKRIVEIIEEPISTGSYEHFISANIGISEFPADGEDFEKLIHKADEAMYFAKINNIPYASTEYLQDLK